MKRQVTQEELDAAYAALRPRLEPTGSDIAAGELKEANKLKAAAASASEKVEQVGVHIGQERTNILFLSGKHNVVKHLAINSGLDSPDKLLAELSRALENQRGSKTPVYFTVTGKPSHFVLTKVPKLARAQMLKAFKVQMKHSSGSEWDDLQFVALPSKKGETTTEYLVGGMDKIIVEKVFRHLRKLKLRVQAWDIDLLCYARAANHLWQRHKLDATTRFLVLLDWDHCYLMIQGSDGRLISPRLPIGINSFLEHLLQTRENTVPRAADEKDWRVLGANPVEVRERRVLANQAIHDVYVPLGQQIKTQLFAGCNEHGVQLPTHFAVASVGANLFHLVESLSADLGLKPIALEDACPVESVAALGATLWEKNDLRLNFLPRGKGEMIRALKELFKNAKGKVPDGKGFSLPSFGSRGAALGIVGGSLAVACMVGYPIWNRFQVSSKLEARRLELASLQNDKERIAKSKERETLTDRKVAMVKVIEARRPQMSHALNELISVLPAEIQLQTLSYKDNMLTLKGNSKNALAVQNFLRAALELRLLKEPTPVGIKREHDTIQFEITFKFKA